MTTPFLLVARLDPGDIACLRLYYEQRRALPTRMNFTNLDRPIVECPCQAAYDPARRQHYVWVAFLHYDNDDEEYRRQAAGENTSWASFVNWATCVVDWSTIFHCQMFFWHHRQRAFVTFSIDAVRNRVFSSSRKRFKRGWTFVRLEVSEEQEIDMYNFFVEQLQRRAPFNRVGLYSVLFRPIDSHGTSWFCSQLVTAALQAAGTLAGVRAHAVSPATLYSLLHRRRADFTDVLDTDNPVLVT